MSEIEEKEEREAERRREERAEATKELKARLEENLTELNDRLSQIKAELTVPPFLLP